MHWIPFPPMSVNLANNFNQMMAFYNKIFRRRMLRKQLEKESRAVRAGSLEVLHEMEALEDDWSE